MLPTDIDSEIHVSIIYWCVCVCVRERERERESEAAKSSQTLVPWAPVAMHSLSSLKKGSLTVRFTRTS